MKKYLEIGKVNNTHGIKGEIKLTMWCDGIDYIKQLKHIYKDDRGENALTIVNVRQQKNIAIIKFSEINSIEEAELLKNKILYCNRDDVELEEGKYYLADLIGCRVVDNDTDEDYGKIVDIENHGSCDIYDVVKDKKHTLIPAIKDIVKLVDVKNNIVKICPMKGLFDED